MGDKITKQVNLRDKDTSKIFVFGDDENKPIVVIGGDGQPTFQVIFFDKERAKKALKLLQDITLPEWNLPIPTKILTYEFVGSN